MNFLPIHKITKDLNCHVTFFPHHCVFEDPVIGRTIKYAKE